MDISVDRHLDFKTGKARRKSLILYYGLNDKSTKQGKMLQVGRVKQLVKIVHTVNRNSKGYEEHWMR